MVKEDRLKLGDILRANNCGAFSVLASIGADGKKRYERRKYIEEIEREIALFSKEREAIIAAEGMDPKAPGDAKDPRWPIAIAKIEEYLETESTYRPEPLFAWADVDIKTTRDQELALEAVLAVAPYVEDEIAAKKPTKGAHEKGGPK